MLTLSIAIGADHGGLELKEKLCIGLRELCQVEDMGVYSLDPDDDYPDISLAVAEAVASGKADRGIIICGSGVGACIAANKVPGIRASVCHDTYSAWQGVEHDGMNVLCLGARVIGIQLAQELITSFINATFSDRERYRRRVKKVRDIEKRFCKEQ